MRVEFNKFNKTIEDMAQEGYKPVLNPCVLALRVDKNLPVEKQLEQLPEAIMNMYKVSHAGNPLVDMIEVAVVKLDIKGGYDKDGNLVIPGVPVTPLGEKSAITYVPLLPYVRIQD